MSNMTDEILTKETRSHPSKKWVVYFLLEREGSRKRNNEVVEKHNGSTRVVFLERTNVPRAVHLYKISGAIG